MTMRSLGKALKTTAAAGALAFGFAMAGGLFIAPPAFAQGSGQGGHSGSSGDHQDHSDHSDQEGHQGEGHEGGQSGSDKGQGKGAGAGGRGGVEGHIFEEDEGPSDDAKGPKYGGGRDTGKPPEAGSKKGDLFGDMWVILRDENGVPILTEEGFVQPIDADGNLIPLDEEGAPLDETLTVEIELGRSNVGRSPNNVIERQLEEAVVDINSASAVSLDSSGRLVLTIDGVEKTIDSPPANLAIYEALMTSGTIPGIADPAVLGDLGYLADGVKTIDDLAAAAGFLAGATDKEGTLTIDEVIYLNSILGIPGTITGEDGNTYVDFSDYTYDRESVYGDATANVLVETSPGVFEVQTVQLYDVLFDGANVNADAAAAFTQAADDARTILLYLHDNEPR